MEKDKGNEMTREETKEAIKVMQAFVDGDEVQAGNYSSRNWVQAASPGWNWRQVSYRIKPKPTELTIKQIEERLGISNLKIVKECM